MADTTLSLLVIRVEEFAASLAFYSALGLALVEEQHGSGPVHYSCDLGGAVLELYPAKASAPAAQSAHTTMIGFKVVSLDDALANLKRLGIEPNSPPREAEWGRWVNVNDPDGRTIQISEMPASG